MKSADPVKGRRGRQRADGASRFSGAFLGIPVLGWMLIFFAVPSWRADVEGKADIVKEVVRIVGVDQVRRYETPPFRLSPGVHHLRLECQAARSSACCASNR